MTSIISSGMNSLPDFTFDNTILLDDGIYQNINLIINNEGTITNPIIIKPKNNGKVFFTESVYIKITGKHIILSNIIFTNGKGSIDLQGSNNRITNCEFSLNAGDGPVVNVFKYNNRLDHNIFKDFTNSNPWVQVSREDNGISDYIIIDSNVFMNRKKGTGNGFETIRFGLSDTSLSQSHSVIENNIFENCNGEIEIVSNKAGGNIYYKNTFKTSFGSLTLRHGNNVLVAKNKFLQDNADNAGGIRIAAGSGHTIYNNLFKNTNRPALIINSGANDGIYNIQVSYTKFLKNIFLDCLVDISIGSVQFPISPRLCSFYDNVVVKNNNDPVYQINSNMIDFDFQNNIYKVNNMGNIPNNYNQQIYSNDFLSKVDMTEFGSTEFGSTNILSDIIFDNKYGDEYYKYLNKTIYDEINHHSLQVFHSQITNDVEYNLNYTSQIPLPSAGSSFTYNPFMFVFLFAISFLHRK